MNDPLCLRIEILDTSLSYYYYLNFGIPRLFFGAYTYPVRIQCTVLVHTAKEVLLIRGIVTIFIVF